MRLFLLTLLATFNLMVASATGNPTNPKGNGNPDAPKYLLGNKNTKQMTIAKINGQDVVSVPIGTEGALFEYSTNNFRTVAGVLKSDNGFVHIPFSSVKKEKVAVREVNGGFSGNLVFLNDKGHRSNMPMAAFLGANKTTVCSADAGVVLSAFTTSSAAPYRFDFYQGDAGGVFSPLPSIDEPTSTTKTLALNASLLTNNTTTDVSYPFFVEIYTGVTPGTPGSGTLDGVGSQSINVRPIPTLTVTPTTSPVCNGAAISASASTIAGLPTTTWKYETVPNGTGLPVSSSYGPTNNSLSGTATNATGADLTGTYSFYVKYATGVACEQFVTNSLVVQSIPVITTPPTNQTVCFDSPATFSVVALGSGITYQWNDGSMNVGSNSASYTTSNTVHADATKVHKVTLTNACTSMPVVSSTATLTVNAKVISTTAGADVTVCSNPLAAVSIAASSTLSDASTWTTGMWSGGAGSFGSASSASTTYTPAAADRGTVVTLTWTVTDPDGAGPCVGGQTATKKIKVLDLPAASAAAISVCSEGQSPSGSGVSRTITATGMGTFLKVGVPVQTSGASTGQASAARTSLADGALLETGNITNTSNTTNAVLTYTVTPYNAGIDGIDDGGANDDCLGTPFDVVVTVYPEIIADGLLTQTPASVCVGSKPTIGITGLLPSSSNYEIDWSLGSVGGPLALTGLSFSTPNPVTIADDGSPFNINTITNTVTGCFFNPSSPLTVEIDVNKVNAGTITNGIPTKVCVGYDPMATEITSAGSGGDGDGLAPGSGVTYQWVESATDIFTAADISVNIKANLGTAVSAADNTSTSTPDFNAYATAGHKYYSLKTISTPLSGDVCYAYDPPKDVTIKDDIAAAPAVTANLPIICAGDDVTLGVGAVPAAEGSGTATYVWQSSTTSATTGFANIAGATATTVYGTQANVTVTNVTADTWYRVLISDNATIGCATNISNPTGAAVDVNEITDAGTITSPAAMICSDVDPGANFAAAAATADGTVTYRWESSITDFAPMTAIVMEGTSMDLDPAAINNVSSADVTYSYRRITISTKSGKACEKPSNVVTIIVKPEPDVTVAAVATAATCSGTAINYNLVAQTNFPAATFTYGLPAFTGGMTGGAARASATNANITDSYTNTTGVNQTATYTVTPWNGTCQGADFNVVVTVSPAPTATQPASVTICAGSEATIIVPGNVTSMFGTADLQVTYTITGGITETKTLAQVGTSAEGTFTTTKTFADADDNAKITITKIKHIPSGCEITPAFTDINVDVNIFSLNSAVASTLIPTTVCDGYQPALNALVLTGTPTGEQTLHYEWESSFNGNPFITATSASTFTYNSLSTNNHLSAIGTGTWKYRLRVHSGPIGGVGAGTCSAVTNELTVEAINQLATPTITPDISVVCPDATVSVSLAAMVSNAGTRTLTYAWASSLDDTFGTTVAGGAAATESAMPTEDTWYHVSVSDATPGCTTKTSDPAVIVVNNVGAGTLQTSGSTACSDTPFDVSIDQAASFDTYDPGVQIEGTDPIYSWEIQEAAGSFTTLAGATDSQIDADGINNITNANVTYTYKRKATSMLTVATGITATCTAVVTASIDILPEPVSDLTVPSVTVCSDITLGVAYPSSTATSAATTGFDVTVDCSATSGFYENALNGFGINTSFSQILPSDVLETDSYINQTNAPQDVIYKLQPKSVDGCAGEVVTFTATINPEPYLANPPTAAAICPGSDITITLPADNSVSTMASYVIDYPMTSAKPDVTVNNVTVTIDATTTPNSQFVVVGPFGNDEDGAIIKNIVLTGANGCTGSQDPVTIDVIQVGVGMVEDNLPPVVCDGYDPIAFTALSIAGVVNEASPAVTDNTWEELLPGADPLTGWGTASGTDADNPMGMDLGPVSNIGDIVYRFRARSTLAGKECTVYSTAPDVTMTVNNDVSVTTITPDITVVCPNTAVTLSAAALTGGIAPTFQWEESADDVTYVNATGASTATTYTTPSLADDMYYRLIATESAANQLLGCDNSTSLVTPVIVNNVDPGTVIASLANPCSKEGFSIDEVTPADIDSYGGGTTPTYTWSVNPVLTPALMLGTAASTPSVTITNTSGAAVSYIFTRTAESTLGIATAVSGVSVTATCMSDITSEVIVSPEPVAMAADITVCSNTLATIALSSNVAGTEYSWTHNNPAGLTNITPALGTITASPTNITVTPINKTGANVTITYVSTPTSPSSCVGADVTTNVTVRSEPVGANSLTQKCSDVPFDIDPQGSIAATAAGTGTTVYSQNGGLWGNAMAASTFAWKATSVPLFISGVALNDTGTGHITGTLTNNAVAVQTVVYSVTPTSADGCVGAPFTVTVKINGVPLIGSNASGDNSLCVGEERIVNATVLGGVAPYIYAWTATPNTLGTLSSTTVQSPTYTPTAAGNVVLSVSVTDSKGCSAIAAPDLSFEINPNPAVALTPTHVDCYGASNGKILAEGSLGTAPYSYKLQLAAYVAGTPNHTFMGISPGTYTVTVKDDKACTATADVTITQPVAPVTAPVTAQVNVKCYGAATGSVTLAPAGGTAGYTLSAALAATPGTLVGTVSGNTVSGLIAGTYNISVTDMKGCVLSVPITITEPALLGLQVASKTNVICNAQANGTVTLSATGGVAPYTFTSSSAVATHTAPSSPLFGGLVAGTYTFTVTDVNLCTVSVAATITEPAPITVTETLTDVSCKGGTDGKIVVVGTGGTGTFEYNKNGGLFTPSGTFASLTAGVYTIISRDFNGCMVSKDFTITEPTEIVLTTTQVNVSCKAGINGTATVTATGGTTPYASYTWSNTATGATLSGVIAGTYTVTVVDAKGCEKSIAVTITEPTLVISASVTTVTDVSCKGDATGKATVAGAGGNGGFTYNWGTAGATPTAAANTALAAGVYIVTVADVSLCSTTVTVTIGEPTLALTAATAVSDVSCKGDATGTATATATGGNGSFTYNWSNGQTTATATALLAGSYTVTVTDAKSCTTTATALVGEPAAVLSIVATPSDVSCNGNTNGKITVVPAGGNAGYVLTSPSGTVAGMEVSGLAPGTYIVTLTDAKSCSITATAVIGEPTVLAASTAVTDVSCNGGANGTATVTPMGGNGTYTYQWSNVAASTTATATGLIAGTYMVTVTDAKGCTVVATTTAITEPSAVTLTSTKTDVTCFGRTDGTATVSATGGNSASYTLTSPSGTVTGMDVSGLAAGTHVLTVTDANMCPTTISVTITQPAVLAAGAVSISRISCFGGSNGMIDFTPTGGTTPYNYAWGPSAGGITGTGTTLPITGLSAGAKIVTITDAHGCTVTATGTVPVNSAITVTAANRTITNVSCNGGTNGSVALKATGGSPLSTTYRYAWSVAGTTTYLPTAATYSSAVQTKSSLPAGIYSVTLTNTIISDPTMLGCPSVITVTVTEPSAITVTPTQTNVLCKGAATGSTTVTSTGGTGVHTYKWSLTSTPAMVISSTATASGLVAGDYTVTVTDGNLCTKTSGVTITEPVLALTATSTAVDVLCKGGTGTATAVPAGGTSPYTYKWSDAAVSTGVTATGLVAGTYMVTVTDANACTVTSSVTVIEPTLALSATTTKVDVLCKGNATGTATAVPAGGTSPYTYLWNDVAASTTATATGLIAGTYNVTVTDANACSTTATTTVIEPTTGLTATTSSIVNVLCKGAATGSATAVPAGGSSGYTYLWSDAAASTTATATGLIAGTYTVIVTDANMCSTTATALITEPTTVVAVTTTVTDVKCKGDATGSATATAADGTSGYTYLWDAAAASATTATASNLIAGTYMVTATDANGCTVTGTAMVAEPTLALSATEMHTDVLCFGQSNGTAAITGTGGTAPYTLSSPSGTVTMMNVTGLAMGTYVMTVTDANLCTTTVSVVINQPAVLAVTAAVTNVPAVICGGSSDGILTMTPTGGTAPYTYVWSPTNATATVSGNVISGLTAGIKLITITDANGCTATTSRAISQSTLASAIALTYTHVKCFGASTGAVVFRATGGSGSGTTYTYNWGGVGNIPTSTAAIGTTVTNTGLAAGAYPVTITKGGCSNVITLTITQPLTPVSATTTVTNVACKGGNGTATAIPAGGTVGAGYTYKWSDLAASTTATATAIAGAYIVTVTDGNGCTVTSTATITEPTDALSATFTQVDVLCKGEATGSVVITPAGGTPGYTITPAQTGLVAGAYVFTVTDANLCTTTVSTTITEPAVVLSAAIAQTNVTCNGANDGTVTITPAGGAGGYTIAPTTMTALAPGAYSFTVTDANLCTTVVSATITEPVVLSATLTQSNPTCRGGSDGSVTITPVGGTSPFTFAPATTGLAAGTYSFTVTDANLCTTTVGATITEPAAVDRTATVCSRVATGITLNNPAAATYNVISIAMNGLTETAGTPAMGTGLTAAEIADDAYLNNTAAAVDVVYTIAPVSATGCIGLPDVVTVTVNPEPGSPTLTTIQRCSATPFTIDQTNLANALAGTTFTWTAASASNPAFINPALVTSGTNQAAITGTYSNLSTSDVVINYAITATSAQGCAAPAFNIAVTLNGQPNVTPVSLGGAKVCKDADRDLLAVTVGGSGSYTYNWSSAFANGGAGTLNDNTLESPTFHATAPGKATFKVTVTDTNGCVVASSPYNLTINDTPSFTTVTSTNVACYGATTGQIVALGTGGNTSVASPSYNYQLNVNPFQASGTFSNLAPGTYTVIVKDGNGCTNSDTKIITQPTAPLTSTIGSQTNVSCNAGTDGSVTLNATGGTAPYTYSAGSGTVAGNVISGLVANTYNVTITDMNSCTYTIPVNISEPSALNLIVATQTNVTCTGLTNGSVTLSANGGSTPYEYTKNGAGAQASPTFGTLAAGVYTFAVKDVKLCTNTVSVTITEPAAITITPTVTNVTCGGAANGQVALVATGGASPFEYKLGTGGFQSLSTFTSLSGGVYTVEVKDANGCTASSSVTITEPAPVTVAFTTPVLSVLQGTAQAYTLSATYASYAWSAVPSGATVTAGGTASDNTVTYNFATQGVKPISVTVTDASGCSASTSISVDVVPFVLVSPKAKLQGNFSSATGLMNDKLRTLNLIPAAQPYTTGFTQVNNTGTEMVAPAVLAVTGNNAIVDWVFVQLRSSANNATVVSTRSALLQRDGDIVEVDGVSPVKMIVPLGTSDFYVTVKHRNHLGVMTAAAQTLSSSTTTLVDFTAPATATYTDGANTAQLGTTTKVMRAGNANGNRNVKGFGLANDKDAVLAKVGSVAPTTVISGYNREDVNMDGLVKYEGLANDRAVIESAVGAATPNAIINEQTPN